MLISGNTLPVLSTTYTRLSDQDKVDQDYSDSRRFKQSDQQPGQQTAEFIFRGVFDEEFISRERVSQAYQQIDPANESAINQYAETRAASLERPARRGRLLDIYI